MNRRRVPATLLVGSLLIALLEALLFLDVLWTHRGALHTHAAIRSLPPPSTPIAALARWTAFNFTPLVWPAYLVLLDGALTWQTATSPIRRRPHHFATLCLASILLWCLFDTINFYLIRAWSYIGMPAGFADRAWGYVLAFGSIAPAMLLTGQLILNAIHHLRDATTPNPHAKPWASALGSAHPTQSLKLRLGTPGLSFSAIAGASMLLWPVVDPNPITNLTLWAGFVFLLDPINYHLARPSFFRDLEHGNLARPISAMLGGLACGLLWEFWNYWALAKWTYHLPFLGAWEHIKYFEMPFPGLLGFLPFGLAVWVMWQTLQIPLSGLVEPLPDNASLL